jgi:hypothetical protein
VDSVRPTIAALTATGAVPSPAEAIGVWWS